MSLTTFTIVWLSTVIRENSSSKTWCVGAQALLILKVTLEWPNSWLFVYSSEWVECLKMQGYNKIQLKPLCQSLKNELNSSQIGKVRSSLKEESRNSKRFSIYEPNSSKQSDSKTWFLHCREIYNVRWCWSKKAWIRDRAKTKNWISRAWIKLSRR